MLFCFFWIILQVTTCCLCVAENMQHPAGDILPVCVQLKTWNILQMDQHGQKQQQIWGVGKRGVHFNCVCVEVFQSWKNTSLQDGTQVVNLGSKIPHIRLILAPRCHIDGYSWLEDPTQMVTLGSPTHVYTRCLLLSILQYFMMLFVLNCDLHFSSQIEQGSLVAADVSVSGSPAAVKHHMPLLESAFHKFKVKVTSQPHHGNL